jgi:hypothetical protein
MHPLYNEAVRSGRGDPRGRRQAARQRTPTKIPWAGGKSPTNIVEYFVDNSVSRADTFMRASRSSDPTHAIRICLAAAGKK